MNTTTEFGSESGKRNSVRKRPLWKETWFLRGFGFTKIPLLFLCRPQVLALDENHVAIRIPLDRWTRNHLKSLYFGTLAIGADCAGGMIAAKLIHDSGEKVSLIFKDFHAEFLKRAEGDTVFTCTDGVKIRDLVKRTLDSGQRESLPVEVIATVPSKLGDEPVARFTLTLSLKKSMTSSRG